MRDISITECTFDCSIEPCFTRELVPASSGATPAGVLNMVVPSFCSCWTLSKRTRRNLPRRIVARIATLARRDGAVRIDRDAVVGRLELDRPAVTDHTLACVGHELALGVDLEC